MLASALGWRWDQADHGTRQRPEVIPKESPAGEAAPELCQKGLSSHTKHGGQQGWRTDGCRRRGATEKAVIVARHRYGRGGPEAEERPQEPQRSLLLDVPTGSRETRNGSQAPTWGPAGARFPRSISRQRTLPVPTGLWPQAASHPGKPMEPSANHEAALRPSRGCFGRPHVHAFMPRGPHWSLWSPWLSGEGAQGARPQEKLLKKKFRGDQP